MRAEGVATPITRRTSKTRSRCVRSGGVALNCGVPFSSVDRDARRVLDAEEARGSNPLAPTSKLAGMIPIASITSLAPRRITASKDAMNSAD
jgi:hypothetical protein